MNDIACNLDRTWNFTEFKFIWVGLRFNGIESKFLNWIQTLWIEFEFEFQFNSIQFNSTIELRFNWRGMKCNLVEKIMKIYLWIWCREKKNFKKTQEWQQNHKEGKVQDGEILMLLTPLKHCIYWCKWGKTAYSTKMTQRQDRHETLVMSLVGHFCITL